MMHKQLENYLLILETLQNDTGKLAALECELGVWRSGATARTRINICCNEDGTFLVYLAPDATAAYAIPDNASQSRCPSATSSRWQESRLVPPQEGERSADVELPDRDEESIQHWVEGVCEFGMGGSCNSLTALFHFGYNEWKRLLRGAFPMEVISEFDKQVAEDSHIAFHEKHSKLSRAISKDLPPHVLSVETSSAGELLERAHLASSGGHHEQVRDMRSKGIAMVKKALQRCQFASSAEEMLCEESVSMLYQFLLLRASTLMRLRHYNSAFKDAEELISWEPTCADGYYWKALALRGMSRRGQEPIESLMQALACDPENALYQQVFASFLEEMSTPSMAPTQQGRVRGRHIGDAQSATTQATHLSSRSTTPTEVSIPLSRSSSNDSL